MNKRFTKLIAALALLVFMMPSLAGWGQTRDEEVYSTCRFGSGYNPNNSSYTSTFTVTNGNFQWTVGNGNNNNNGWTNNSGYGQVKFGRKNNASVGYITTAGNDNAGCYAEAITKIDLTIDAITTNSINSIKLYTSADNSSWTEAGSFEKSTGTKTVSLANPTANLYYKVEFDCASGSSNGLVTVSKVEYYYNAGGTPTCATPTFSPAAGTYTEAQTVSINCATENSTIYYTTDGTDPTTSSSVYSTPINVNANMTIKAMATATDYDNSAVATAAYTIITLEHAGSLEDPYTVADARAAIDANAGTQGVYATGIVSEIVTAYSSQYSNITFNMVDEEGDEVFLQAYRCTGDEAENVIVGDIAVVYGNLTKYNTTYEFTSGCQVVSLTHPSTPYITAEDVEITYDTDADEIEYTINNPVDGGVLTANTQSDWLTLGEVGATVPFTCSANPAGAVRTATVTLTYTYNRETVTKDVTVTQAGNPNVFDNIEDITQVGTAYSVRGTVVAVNSRGFVMGDGTGYVYYYKNAAPTQSVNDMVTVAGTTGSYGQIIQFTNSATVAAATTSNYNGTPAATVITAVPDYTTGYHLSSYFEFEGELTKSSSNYFIALGEEQIQISYPTNDQGTALTALNGKTVHVKGYFTGINSSSKFTVMLESVEEVYVPTVPVINANDVNIAFTATSGSIAYTIQDGEGMVSAVITEGDWLTLGEITATEVPFTCSANEGDARTATVTLSFEGADDKVVTITQAAYADIYSGEGTFNKATSLDDLEDGGYYVLVNSDYAMNSTISSGKMSGTAVTIVADAITNPSTSIVWKLEKNGDNWNIYNEQIEKYCYIEGSSSSSFKTGTAFGASYVVTYDNGFYFQSTDGNGRAIAYYAANHDFRTYTSGSALTLYKLGEASTDPFISIANPTIEVAFEGGNGTVEVTYGNITDIDASVYFCDADGEAASYDWMTASINPNNNVAYTVDANNGDARTAYLKVKVGETYSNLITVSQAAYVAPFEPVTYTRATSIISGRHYIITNGSDKAMGEQGSNNRPAVEVDIEEDVATVNSADVYEFVINGPDADGYYTIYDAKEPGYLYAASSSSNHLRTEAHLDANNNALWTISISTNGDATIVAQGNNTNKYMRFNNTLFSCYGENSSVTALPYLYMKDNETEYTFVKDIAAYQGDGGYVLVASPVSTTPAAAGMITTESNYDLYYFDDTQDWEWINYKADENGGINAFDLEPGTGYLYANSANVTLTFAGTPAGNGQIPVIAGWNLVGNPFGVAATPNMPYYRLDSEGGALNAETESGAVSAMEGVFVNATEAGNVTFSTSGNSKGQNIALNLSRNERSASVIDRAIVRFDEGQQLPKFQFREGSTKLYIAQGNKDYAIVRSAAQGEMPVSFRASANGTYTLAVETENVEMDYLHLIDNMTGADVDLLQTPSYTFEARTSDYASRFRLVFSANSISGEADADNVFAYFDGSSWNVSNLGEATLQVVDMMGRTLSSQTISGNANVSINQPAGIYMLRLVNGNDVKVQKVVVR